MTTSLLNFCPARVWRHGMMLSAGLAIAAVASATTPSLADLAEKGQTSALLARLKVAPAEANTPQADGMTALLWAARHDDVPTARALLAANADPQTANRYGFTALSLACQNGSPDMVALLLDAGADPNRALPGGETPLMTASRTGNLAPVAALLSHGARVNDQLPDGQTALMWAANEGHTPVIDALLAAGAEFHAPLTSGFTPLMLAARGGHTGVIRALLQAGVDINEVTQPAKKPNGKHPRPGTSALIIAIENGHFELAAELLDRGANPNDLRSGYAPLHVLTWVRKPDNGEADGQPPPDGTGTLSSVDLIRKLVAKGADVNLRLTGGLSGGGRMAHQGCTPFLMAADRADTAYLKLLVELGADPLVSNVDGLTAVMAAAGLGTRAVLEEAGTEEESLEAVAYLIELGADINGVTNFGETAMHGAAYANFPKMVKYLDEKGARIETWNQPNKRKWTPQRIAEGHRYGNFKPSFETVAAIKEVMAAHGVTPLLPMEIVPVKGYEEQ